MVPSRTWFPASLQDRAAWYLNFKNKFTALAAALGFTPADIAAVVADNAALQWLASSAVNIDSFDKGMTAYRKEVLEGLNGSPEAMLPTPPEWLDPPTAMPGLFERLDNLVKRIRVAPSYSIEEGMQLGIVPSTPSKVPEGDLKPTVKVSPKTDDYKFTVETTRLGMPAFVVQIQKDGSPKWNDGAYAQSSPVIVTVTPTVPGQPEKLLVRVVLMKDNAQVGIPSDPVYVTVSP